MSETTPNIEELSAEELYALAREREQAEARAQAEQFAEKRAELRQERKAMLARHRKELAEIEREITKLGGTVRRGRTTRKSSDGPTIVDQLCTIVASKPAMTVQEVREQAESIGVGTQNLSQTLAYLKKQGRLMSPERGVYALAESA